MSVVTADEIRNRGATNIDQVFSYSAGFNGEQYGGTGLARTYPFVRGFLAYEYLDGLKLHDSNWSIETFGLDRAELLKGPAGTLYGQASPGGLLDMLSKRPTEKSRGYVDILLGNYSRVQGEFDVSGPVNQNGTILYRAVGLARDANTEVRFTKDQRIYFAPSFTILLGDNTRFTLLAMEQYDPNFRPLQLLPEVGTVLKGNAGYISRSTFTDDPSYDKTKKNEAMVGYLFEHKFSETIVFKQGLRYSDVDLYGQYMTLGSQAANQLSVPRSALLNEYDIHNFQVDNNLDAKFSTGPLHHNLLLGADFSYIPNYQGRGTGAATSINLFNPVYYTPINVPLITSKRYQLQEQTGLYAQDQMNLERLSVVVGVRQDWTQGFNKTYLASTNFSTATVVNQNPSATTETVGASYEVLPGVAPYFNNATSFFPTQDADYANNPLPPTTGRQYEAGLKVKPVGIANLNAILTLAAFDIKQQNVEEADPVHPGFPISVGGVHSRGAEAELKLSLLPQLNTSLAYTHLIDTIDQTSSSASSILTLGKTPTATPNDMAAAWVDYAPDFLLRGLRVGSGVKYFGSSWGDVNNTFRVSSYYTIDALIRYDFGALNSHYSGWQLSANAQNLLDRRYVAGCFANTQCYYGLGAQYRADLSFRW